MREDEWTSRLSVKYRNNKTIIPRFLATVSFAENRTTFLSPILIASPRWSTCLSMTSRYLLSSSKLTASGSGNYKFDGAAYQVKMNSIDILQSYHRLSPYSNVRRFIIDSSLCMNLLKIPWHVVESMSVKQSTFPFYRTKRLIYQFLYPLFTCSVQLSTGSGACLLNVSTIPDTLMQTGNA